MTQINASSLNLIEIFASIQGESSLAGLPTTFIRLAACNLRCSWCDTPYSFGRGEKITLSTIIEKVKGYACPYVCVTGGEPLLQKNIYPLMQELCDQGYIVSVETGGSLKTSLVDSRVITILDIKCPGSGMSDRNEYENLNSLRAHDEVKFVIKDRIDYEWALKICGQYDLFNRTKSVLFSPVFDHLEAKVLVQWILNDRLPIRLNLQLHKFVWEPETIGV